MTTTDDRLDAALAWARERYGEKGLPYACEICGTTDPTVLRDDHCHATNRTRGYLCNAGNLGLGHFGDRIDRLQSAIAYLAKYAVLHADGQGRPVTPRRVALSRKRVLSPAYAVHKGDGATVARDSSRS